MHPAIRAFILSPLVASLPIPAILDGSFAHYFELEVWILVIPAAYGSALILGLPLYFALRHKIRYTRTQLVLAGFLIALAPLLFILPIYLGTLVFFFLIGLCGALGGYIFWLTTRQQHQT